VLGRSVSQDGNDILTGVPLPIITNPLLPSLIPLNEEESLLFSGIRPLQGDALIKAAGITRDDLEATQVVKSKGKKRNNSWTIPAPQSIVDDTSPPTQEPQYDMRSTSDTYSEQKN